MAQTCGSGIVKLILIILNLVYLVLGLGITYIGYKLFHIDGLDGAFKLADVQINITIIILVVGVIIVVVAALGFFGACCESSCMLNTYAFLLVVLIIAEVYLVYKSISQHSNIEDEIGKGMTNAIKEMSNNTDTARILQKLQITLKCCGWNGPDDYSGNNNFLASCCDDWKEGDSAIKTCPKSEIKFHKGCKEQLHLDTLKTYLGSSTGVGIAAILAQLILIFASCCLARDI